MSREVYSFREAPTYRTAAPGEKFRAALDMPLSATSTFFDQAKGGILESFGLGTAIRDITTPEGKTEDDGIGIGDIISPHPLLKTYDLAKRAVQSFINDEDSPALSEDAYKSSAWFREGVQWDSAMTEQRASALAESFDAKKVREFYASKRPITAFIGNLAGQATDPINYIPIAGPAVRAAAVARLGKVTGASVAASLDAAANTAIFGVATAGVRGRLGDDVSWQTTVSQIATAALIGAGFGAIGGALGKRADAASRTAIEERLATLKTTQEARIALNEGIDALVRGEDVRLSPNATEPLARVAGEIERIRPQRGGFISVDAGERLGVAGQPDTAAVRYEGETFVARDHAEATKMAVEKYGVVVARAIEASPEKFLGYVTDKVDSSGVALIPADHGEMGIPKPKQGVDDRVYAIHRNGEAVGYANIRVDGDVATVRDIYSTETLDSRNSMGTAAVAKLMRQFIKENPDIRTIQGERVSGARRGGKHGLAGTGENVAIALPRTRLAIDATPARADPPPEGIKDAEKAIAKPDDYKALSSQYRVDPETGSFDEEVDIAQLGVEGRLTEDDVATLADAQAVYEDGAAYGEALKSVAGCLI